MYKCNGRIQIKWHLWVLGELCSRPIAFILQWMSEKWNSAISSPELKARWWAYRIGWPPLSSVIHTFKRLLLRNQLASQKSNFIWSLHGIGERKFVQMVQVTRPRWPPSPYMVKPLKKLLLLNQKADDLEAWWHWSKVNSDSTF